MSACLPSFRENVRDDLVVAKGGSMRAKLQLRVSAWLPPGLALAWLALLATLIHSVASVLTAWAATVCMVILLRLYWSHRTLHRQQGETSSRPSSSAKPAEAAPLLPVDAGAEAQSATARGPAGIGRSVDARAEMTAPSSGRPVLVTPTPEPEGSHPVVQAEPTVRQVTRPASSTTSAPSATMGSGRPDLAARFQILTAGEVASVLRVKKDLIVDAIKDGELPGNRIGPHWRVDQALLTRWLYGNYEQPGPPTGPDDLLPGQRLA